MSKTVELAVIITCDDEDDYDTAVDNIMDTAMTWSGGISFPAWADVQDDD